MEQNLQRETNSKLYYVFNDFERSLTQMSRSRSYYGCPRLRPVVCAADVRFVCDSLFSCI